MLQHDNCGVTICDKASRNALMCACEDALLDIVELLLSHIECDPCHQDLNGDTALIVCCSMARKNQTHLVKYVRIVQIMLKQDNCGIAICNKEGRNALMYACMSALPKIVELLLSHSKCNPCQQDVNGHTALTLCCISAAKEISNHENCIHIVQVLLKRDNCSVTISDKWGRKCPYECMYVSIA